MTYRQYLINLLADTGVQNFTMRVTNQNDVMLDQVFDPPENQMIFVQARKNINGSWIDIDLSIQFLDERLVITVNDRRGSEMGRPVSKKTYPYTEFFDLFRIKP